MADGEDVTDFTSIKPVSSLRSRFENLGKDVEPQTPPLERRQVSLTATNTGVSERPKTASGEKPQLLAASNATAPLQSGLRRPKPSHLQSRPQSMMDVTPSQKSPPMVTVDSPSSPAPDSINARLSTPRLLPTPDSTGSPTRSHARTLSRATTPALEKRISMFLQDAPPKIDLASKPRVVAPLIETTPPKVPPPVNRTAKPSVPVKPATLAQKSNGLAAPEPKLSEMTDHSVSPFSTPPGSGAGSPEIRGEAGVPIGRERNTSDASFVERLRSDSGASSAVYRTRCDSDVSFAERARAGSNASFVEPSSLPETTFHAPSSLWRASSKRDQASPSLARTPTMPARYGHARNNSAGGEVDDDRPRLPARPELQIRSGRTSPTKPRSGRTSPSKLSQQIHPRRSHDGLRRAATFGDQPPPQRIPATRAMPKSALTEGFDRTVSLAPGKAAPAVPAPRRSVDMRRPQMPPPAKSSVQDAVQTNGYSHDDQEDFMPIAQADTSTSASEYPDATQANRRPPKYKQRPFQIFTEYDTRLCAVSGEIVVTSGYITKAWNIKTGEQILNMMHNENVKATSVAFKPALEPRDEGTRIWVGTNIGEIHEIDIPSQRLVKTRANVHTRREVVRMIRHGTQIWTLDDGGELCIWRPDAKGLPNVDGQYHSFRVPRGHSASVVCGNHLWIATGKDIRVFNPTASNDAEFQFMRGTLSQPGAGDVTCGTTLTSTPDVIYFGHSDGKVSVYNCKDFSAVSVVTVSLYKIASLAGVGDRLWAGFNTGMIYIYDISTTPWRVKKDWEAHEKKQVCSIVPDASALWSMDRLQVVTLGTDNILRIWDGFLQEDWLDSRMQSYDSRYCAYRELTASVLTWNAGASKPQYLQQNHEDNNFFRDYLSSGEPPDILVFGFQELVDLEDKKTTAKSFFKSKKKDGGDQEHMSHQYRAWRDHLTRCLEEHIPANVGYALLHTASMVGLFTCIFVKSTVRSRIKHVHTAEVKRGMGGRYGNKGALILRMVLDDSSLCFINCHLAAGQTQTINRNNDAAAILEAEALPPYPLANSSAAQHNDVFASGGDGSLVLDHEICILNGDLNYRIDTMGRDTVIKHVAQNNLARLLERDQLLLSRKKNPGFRLRAFQENPITFAPTYKYNLHSDDYDNSEKRRAPAWCDRILYRGLGRVKLEEYRRWDVRVSDHRPVSGRLRMRVKTVDAGKRAQVWEVCKGELEVRTAEMGRSVMVEYCVNVLGMTAQKASAAVG
ncbi:hypothetical protein LTR78_000187 [Recurvomyces mirabilis]|uniref:Inositol polyphosphate-related phosphatase domain-containing protein n=1 Tax=Recurvomyces mirabilis TaxID=574656 RepID=A0AAE0WWN5_9PEZI|nr:hypothetical protein LTR78_000187 [Recurvomyces mirabilis]KAK5161844.1 hypothetical protein LTS14_000189 [Recurvomyces mirabilis]